MTEPSSSPSDLMFDPWLTFEGPSLKALSEQVIKLLHEAAAKPSAAPVRKRRPKAEVVERRTAIVSSIIANLYRLHGADPESLRDHASRSAEFLAVPMQKPKGKASRYDRKGFAMLPEIVRSMMEAGHVVVRKARIKVTRTGIKATGWLLETLRNPRLSPSELGRAEGEEVIWLTARMGKDSNRRKLPQERVDYADTEETLGLRAEVQELNMFLRAQRIELDGIRRSDITLVRRFSLKRLSDPHRFDLHGRLYGAFWLSLPARRRAGLRINGEPIVDLDLSNLFPRLAYLHVGKDCPEGDLYDIPGLGAAEHRGTVKAGLSAMLSSSIPLAHLPRDVSKALPPGWTDKRFIAAIHDKHRDLVPAFGRDLGMIFMLIESRIMLAAALSLAQRHGIPALLIHDGAMVPASGEEEAREAMRKACLEALGSAIPVMKKQ